MIQMPSLHQVRDFLEPRLLAGGCRLTGHHLLDLASVLLHELARASVGPEQDGEQPIALMFRSDFGSPEKVAFAQDTHELPARIYDRQTADVVRKHQLDSIGDRSLGPYGHDPSGHYLVRA